ncbi:FAD/NAD(P)-binding protein [Rhizobium sp. P44RR-XXIV]|uniref:FAD/NAD(P)-binding protein n=1 Tax=Rhizobium sp. P44RR-XXIV TaxID=1921145 RepID=UPI000984E984|nr:FAD/NAD(P)-binding protein [Rhizobium sp. P44RR-XXIV]TIX90579.1 FAD-dependent oxidoreductase [Rhizobium sp. P44RR-XXIV]
MHADLRSHHSIVIVGGGFAGALTAIKLLDRTEVPLSITILEPREELGRGVAYSTTEAVHLLNGPAGTFSIHPEEPDHLTRWLADNASRYGWTLPADISASFPPRHLYGTYVRDELSRAIAQARAGSTLQHIRSSASELIAAPHRVRIKTEDGKQIEADEVVLALGVFQPDPAPREAPVAGHPAFAASPWDATVLDRLREAEEILLIGSSLSMVDAVASMEARGFRGGYHVISRRGQFIEDRRDAEPARDFLAEQAFPTTARSLLSIVKSERRALAAAGKDWQGLPIAIRPHILTLWQKADDVERLRFARHLRAFWDVTAHRAAPDSYHAVTQAIAEGRLRHQTARLIAMKPAGRRISATLKSRTGVETRSFGGVIDCRGHQLHDWRRISAPFVRSLLESGEVRPHNTGFGIDATVDGDIISEEGRIHRNISAIGHPLRGVAWESSSITEQRAQAIALADRILGKLTPLALVAS